MISQADLILNPDGSIYHLNLLPEDIADTIITVGDPDRVPAVSKHFDRIEVKKGKREFITHTGYVGAKRISVISTGIGTDNIDIVFNELDALVNIDFSTRTVNDKLKSLEIVRVGTSGSIQEDIPMGTLLASSFGLGLDALLHYYVHDLNVDERPVSDAAKAHFGHLKGIAPYVAAADSGLMDRVGKGMAQGITVTAPGFYAPQGRQVRAKNAVPQFVNLLKSFHYNDQRITNLEMETAGMYALARILGHKTLSVNAIVASRVKFEFSTDPYKIVEEAIKTVLERI